MSLFKARDWWSTLCGSEEEFDKGCLCVANIDNDADISDKIIIGSHTGILRVYKPCPTKQEDGSYSTFRPDELLLEVQLNHPIIRISTGLLVSSSSSIHLAVLHPFKLSVYLITAVQGTVEHGTHYHLSLAYEHNLQRHAYNFAIGPFGGIQGKDLICVQSLDGTLIFFEQESFAFSRFLPNSFLPGPLIYVKKTDSFVTASGYQLESYRFQVLAVAKDSDEDIENFRGKRVMADWIYNLGEAVVDIAVVERKQMPSIILVLGEKTLFALNPNGTQKFSKKMDYVPSCFLSYMEGADESIITVIVTCTQTVLIYKDVELKWAAQLPFCPISIQRASFMELKGILVALSDAGSLSCCYMGTDPSLFVSPLTEAREIDFEEAEQEMYKLKKIIKASNSSLPGVQKFGSEISISVIMPHHVEFSSNDDNTVEMAHSKDMGPVPSVTAKIQLKCTSIVHDVRLMIHVEPPLCVCQNIFNLGSILDFSQAIVTVSLGAPYLPSSLKFNVLAVYSNSHGAPRVSECTTLLPFGLVAKTCAPTKAAKHKVTIDINKKIVPVSDLFSDLSIDSANVTGGALGIEYYGGQQATVVASKTALRYRIQSDDFPSMWLIVAELVRRLNYRFRKEDENSRLKCTHSSSLPIEELFNVVEEHFEHRQALEQLEYLLGHRAEQFRVVQKRLLTKLKDKTPTPLNNLDTLLEATYRHILSIAENIENSTVTLESSSCALSCAAHLLLLLLKLSASLKDEDHRFICACFSPSVDVDSQQGWEERVNIALAFLLKYCLGKDAIDPDIPDAGFDIPKDLGKLKKHVKIAVDKILTNSEFSVSSSGDNNPEKSSVNTTNEEPPEDDMVIPVGSKFGEHSNKREGSGSSLSQQKSSVLEPLPNEFSEKDVLSNYPVEYQGNFEEAEMII